MVSIASFNILTSGYCNEKTYPNYPAEAIDNKTRWVKLSEILATLMEKGTFICLQELSEFFRAKLEVLVRTHDYIMIATSYDHYYSGYMGVATLYPARYNLTDCKFIRPATLVKKYITPETEETGWTWFNMFFSHKSTNCEWYEKISKRNNVLLVTSFIKDGHSITIANYHAPCVYNSIKSMCVVAACLLKVLNSIVTPNLYFAGDLNIQPGTLPYQILRTGVLNTLDFDLLQLAGDIDNMGLFGIESAHYTVHNKEPDCTIRSETTIMGNYNKFEGCLDYIFYRSDNPIVVTVHPADSNELLPSIEWPSDHRMLLATF